MTLILIDPPEIEPIGIAEVKAQARIDLTEGEEDALLEIYISAARVQIEDDYCKGIQLVAATYELRLDSFPACGAAIEIPKPPLLELLSVKYLDTGGILTTLYDSTTSPAVDLGVFSAPDTGLHLPHPSKLQLASAQSWPCTLDEANTVRVQFRAGFGEPSISPLTPPEIPAGLRAGIAVLAATLYEHREHIVIGAAVNYIDLIEALVRPYRLTWPIA